MAPVSGSKNTSNEGIKVIIINFKIFLLFFSLIRDTLIKNMVRVSFINSLGWIDILPILSQPLDPFISLPIIKVNISKMILIIYKIKLILNIFLVLILVIKKKVINPKTYQITSLI